MNMSSDLPPLPTIGDGSPVPLPTHTPNASPTAANTVDYPHTTNFPHPTSSSSFAYEGGAPYSPPNGLATQFPHSPSNHQLPPLPPSDGGVVPPRAKPRKPRAPVQHDENGNPIKKPRKKPVPEPRIDPVTGELVLTPAPPKRKRKRAAEGDQQAGGGSGGGGEGGGGEGSGGKKKASRKRPQQSESPQFSSFDAPMNLSGGPSSASRPSSFQDVPEVGYGRVKGPFHKEIMDLLAVEDERPLPETASVLEEILIEFIATLTSSMLTVPTAINLSKDALQASTQFSNSRDGSGVTATAIATAPPIDVESLLFILRSNPTYHERAQEVIQEFALATANEASTKQ